MSIRKPPFITRVFPDSEHGWSTGIPGHPARFPASLFLYDHRRARSENIIYAKQPRFG